MSLRLLSFDAADTLIKVDWAPGASAVECARAVGLEFGSVQAASYDRLLSSRWDEYCLLNLTGDEQQCDAFWDRLTTDWLGFNRASSSYAARIMAQAREWLYGEGIRYFSLFEDVEDCLSWGKSEGLLLAVLSNWDYSLNRILGRLGIADRFDLVVASLTIGPEKPDPRLFSHLLSSLDVAPEEAMHVGDNLLDDVSGARDSGLRALLIDRGRNESSPGVISSLDQLPEAIRWSE